MTKSESLKIALRYALMATLTINLIYSSVLASVAVDYVTSALQESCQSDDHLVEHTELEIIDYCVRTVIAFKLLLVLGSLLATVVDQGVMTLGLNCLTFLVLAVMQLIYVICGHFMPLPISLPLFVMELTSCLLSAGLMYAKVASERRTVYLNYFGALFENM